jgi:hypothetical protein
MAPSPPPPGWVSPGGAGSGTRPGREEAAALLSPPLPTSQGPLVPRGLQQAGLFAHLYVGLARMAVGRIRHLLPDPAGQHLVSQVEAPGEQVRVRAGDSGDSAKNIPESSPNT